VIRALWTRGLWVLLLVLLVACAPKTEVRRYDNSLFELGAAFAAKEVCSCVFVAGRDEADCREWTRVKPDVARFRVDREASEVTARALGMAKTTARYEGDGLGCVLVADGATPAP
jgi:hypothetical protein